MSDRSPSDAPSPRTTVRRGANRALYESEQVKTILADYNAFFE